MLVNTIIINDTLSTAQNKMCKSATFVFVTSLRTTIASNKHSHDGSWQHSSFKYRHELHFDKEKQETCDHTKRFKILTQTEINSKVTPTLFAIDTKFKLKGYWKTKQTLSFQKLLSPHHRTSRNERS